MSSQQFVAAQTDWNLIRAFVAVVEYGSLTNAALQLGLSQATLSRQIAELEQVTGSALFERVARGLKLTVAGDHLVAPARHMMVAARALGMASASQDKGLSGTVRITASEIASAYVLPPILVKLAELHPEIQIELVASNQLSNLLEREADIAIRMLRPTQSALITRHIGDWPLGMYAHSSYLSSASFKNQQQTLKLSEKADVPTMAGYRWIGYDQSDQLLAGFRAAGILIQPSFFAFRCDNHLVNWQALQAGLGIGIGLQWLARQYPDLHRVVPEQALPSLPVWLTSHRELKSNQRIRTVFDFLAQELSAIE
ncbi:MAG: LysR family transcriptional regulator [Burkholderiales bacterium]|nr:LysR family transcriptional regulator [Burkholderiales bacterium]